MTDTDFICFPALSEWLTIYGTILKFHPAVALCFVVLMKGLSNFDLKESNSVLRIYNTHTLYLASESIHVLTISCTV